MKSKILLICCVILSFNIFSIESNPKWAWFKLFGNTSTGCDTPQFYPRDVIELRTGGYLVASTIVTGYGQNFDIYLSKTDTRGDTVWTRNYKDPAGGYPGSFIAGGAVYERESGNPGYKIILSQRVNIDIDSSNIISIHTDVEGKILWTNYTKIPGTNYQVKQTSDNGIIVCGHGFDGITDYCSVVRLDDKADIIWSKKIKQENFGGVKSIDNTYDGGTIIISLKHKDALDFVNLYRLDENGEIKWNKEYQGHPRDISSTKDGGFILSATDDNTSKTNLSKITKLNTLFKDLSASSYKMIPDSVLIKSLDPFTKDMIILSYENYIDSQNYENKEIPNSQATSDRLIKLDSHGNIMWSKLYVEYTFGDYVRNDKYIYDVKEIPSSGFVAVGLRARRDATNTSYSDIYVLRTDEYGERLWELVRYSSDTRTSAAREISLTKDKGYVLTGVYHGGLFLSKLSTDPTYISRSDNNYVSFKLKQNYPNSFNPSTTIKFQIPSSEFVTLKVFNILGKEVGTLVSNKLNQGNHTYTFDGKNLASGVYYYHLMAGDFREVKKMILLR